MATTKEIERLFRANYPAMLRLAVAIVHNRDAANDVVHGVFESLLAADPETTPDTAYLMRATRNRSMNYLRDLNVRQRIIGLYTLEIENDDVVDPAGIPDYERMNRLINEHLTPQTSRVLRLRFYQGMKYAEIAATLSISEAAVYKHLRQAIEILRPLITD